MRLLCILRLALLSHATAFVAQGPRGARRQVSTLQAAAKKSTKKTSSASKTEPVVTKRKPDLIAAVAASTGLSKSDCETCVNALLETIVEEVAAGSKINIAGFGTFKRSDRQARKGRNPKTGEELDIPAKKAPTFTALTAFKSKVNGDV